MQWLIQTSLDRDPKVHELVANLKRLGISYYACKVIPFTDDGMEFADGEPSKDEPCFAFGSYTLARIARRHYSPGAFIGEGLGMRSLHDHYGDEMFNADMQFTTIGEAEVGDGFYFVRPVEDSKSFCGAVMKGSDFKEWRERVRNLDIMEYKTVNLDTEIAIASTKPIDKEARFFIVDGAVVDCSEYKMGSLVRYSPVVDDYIVDYVRDVIKVWEPERAYCLDVAVADGVPKVLETNCINAVGLYAIDTQKLIMAIEGVCNGV